VEFDVFFSISQTPAGGVCPSEAEMLRAFLRQVEAADRLGYGVAWVAESHLSSQVQKGNRRPVIPHWEGEVGLNTDILQLAARVFARTRRIEVGSAVMNALCMGGPIAHAERIASFLAWHGLEQAERRRLHLGFAAGRFDFMNEASGIVPRDPAEEAAWPALKGHILKEATTILLRLLRGDVLASHDVPPPVLTRAAFRSDADWARVQAAAGGGDSIEFRRRWEFEPLKIVPQDFRRELLQPVIGSHDPALQDYANTILPCHVFNLSITRPEIIEATHARMARTFHPDGGAWARRNMPRTVFVFVNEEPGLSGEARRAAARDEARAALSAYWTALEGTLDKQKVTQAADNALIGDAEEVAEQAVARFHRDDRLMLWFDFFEHDCDRVIRNMAAWMERAAPAIARRLA
jgi:alkanesulfonate monooxygenase SsuD/methylene tetrahydromethanopterin reductase-like flavin-dependent oxidoreductase (luciferase family)